MLYDAASNVIAERRYVKLGTANWERFETKEGPDLM
jgi:hypothetical protein